MEREPTRRRLFPCTPNGVRMKTLRKPRPLVVVLLLTLATSCDEDTISIGVPPLPCWNLFVVEPTTRPIILSVGGSRSLRVRVHPETFLRDRYQHCPAMSVHEFVWTVDDPGVIQLEGDGGEVTVTGLAIGATAIAVRYSDYVDPVVRLNDGKIEKRVSLEVVES